MLGRGRAQALATAALAEYVVSTAGNVKVGNVVLLFRVRELWFPEFTSAQLKARVPPVSPRSSAVMSAQCVWVALIKRGAA